MPWRPLLLEVLVDASLLGLDIRSTGRAGAIGRGGRRCEVTTTGFTPWHSASPPLDPDADFDRCRTETELGAKAALEVTQVVLRQFPVGK